MHDAAEYLAMGYLLRRNILAYKAPPRNEGYDLICLHPDPRRRTKVVKVQVKSRYQTDSDRSVFVRQPAFSAFDFLMIVLLNIGWYYDAEVSRPRLGERGVELLVLPRRVARRLYRPVKSGMNRVRTMGHNLDMYKNERGLDLIAKELGVPYPKP
mgnify:CR=1 FL=1